MSYAAISFGKSYKEVLLPYQEQRLLHTYERSDFIFMIKRYLTRYVRLSCDVTIINKQLVNNIDNVSDEEVCNIAKRILNESNYVLIIGSTTIATNIPIQGYFSGFRILGRYINDLIIKEGAELSASGYIKKKDIDFNAMETECSRFIRALYEDVAASTEISTHDQLSLVINSYIEKGLSAEEVVLKYKTAYLLFISSIITSDGAWLDVTDFNNHSDFTDLIASEIARMTDEEEIKLYELNF
jgi:hypothetical protein